MAFSQHNLGTVIGFEFMRTIKKKGFAIATLSIPILMVVLFVLIYASNSSTEASADAQKNSELSFSYTDASGIIPPGMAQAAGGKTASDPETALAAVKDGSSEAYFAYPADPSAEPVKVYGTDVGMFENGKYEAVAKQLLNAAAQTQVDNPQLTAALAGTVNFESETYRDGKLSGGVGSVIPPMLFLVLFYVAMILLSNQMLNSTLEEKENRVTEMILTTLNPTTLITGKVISLFAVGLVQMLVFLTPIAAGYLFFRDSLALPDMDLSTLVFEPMPLIIGALLLLGGFTLFTGVLVAIGAIMPTAKEAGTIFGPLMAAMFIPFYTFSLIISDPKSLIVQVFTYFPLTAPVTAMLRNGFGTLSGVEATIVIAELFIVGALILRLAVHLFRYGSIEYGKKLSIAGTFRRKELASR
ncbi:ABC transporter permease [Pseudarthrobacter polychromogenes]|uniref:Sodium transporter n=1 Tax=Pseudarthrobacter polychromogenes TaxID=1676 RepID=A0ABQ1XK43_9MICC|nr:ABC transporter permease [Pseudarthrobacter polychromogenes]MBD1594394.1 ABC transporter permease [Arthrobacter sp. S1_S22]GGG95885.1 sodium transporter [Pseudarthrobacter polychromogenes]